MEEEGIGKRVCVDGPSPAPAASKATSSSGLGVEPNGQVTPGKNARFPWGLFRLLGRKKDKAKKARANSGILELEQQPRQPTKESASQFLNAVLRNDPATVKQLLEAGWSAEVRDEEGHTGLMAAAQEGHVDMVKILLEHRADTNAKDKTGKTALMYAAQGENESIVHMLIRSGANPNIRGENNSTALLAACSTCRLPIVRVFLEAGADPNVVFQTKELQTTPLLLSCTKSNAVVKELVRRGADVHATDHEGDGVLLHALASADPEVVHSLGAFGGSPDVYNKDGLPPMLFYLVKGDAEMVKALVSIGGNVNAMTKDGVTLLSTIIDYKDKPSIQFVIEMGADVNLPDQGGATPLGRAIRSSNPDAVALLLKAGALPDKLSDGLPPLCMAALMGSEMSTKLLLEAGADPNILDKDGDTAVHNAVTKGHLVVLEELKRSGKNVDWNMWNMAGMAPIHLAAVTEGNAITRFLLDAGARVNKRDRENQSTALHYAVRAGSQEKVETLLTADVEINAGDGTGKTALSLAVLAGDIPMIKLLIAHKADVDLPDNDGDGPIAMAANKSNMEAVSLLVQAGADIHAVNKDGASALIHACAADGGEECALFFLAQGLDTTGKMGTKAVLHAMTSGKNAVVKQMLVGGFDPDTLTVDDTPFIVLAASRGHAEVVKLLISAGANVNAATRSGDTAVGVAARMGHTAMLDLLLAAGASHSMKNKMGNNPLALAILRSQTVTAHRLLCTELFLPSLRAAAEATSNPSSPFQSPTIKKARPLSVPAAAIIEPEPEKDLPPGRIPFRRIAEMTKKFDPSLLVASNFLGPVFKAKHNNRDVLVQVIDRDYGDENHPDVVAGALRLTHPNIAIPLAYSDSTSAIYCVTRYVDPASTLEAFFRRPHKPNLLGRLRIAVGITRALFHAKKHEAGHLHLHLTPACIEVARDLEPMVHGFDIAARLSSWRRWEPEMVGYMCPEYSQCGRVTTDTDIYSLGMILLQLLTWRPAHDPDRRPHVLLDYALYIHLRTESFKSFVDASIVDSLSDTQWDDLGAVVLACVRARSWERPDPDLVEQALTDVISHLLPAAPTLCADPVGPTPTSPLPTPVSDSCVGEGMQPCSLLCGQPATTTLLPCRHSTVCAACANRLDKCTICRCLVSQRVTPAPSPTQSPAPSPTASPNVQRIRPATVGLSSPLARPEQAESERAG